MSRLKQSGPMRMCGRLYKTAEEAARSKEVLEGRREVVTDEPCGHIHTRRKKSGKTPAVKLTGKPKRAPKDTGPSPHVRDLVLARDHYGCARCGVYVMERPHSLHHRRRRSQGGGNEPSNLVTLCGSGVTGCHGWVHANVDEAKAAGWILASGQDPADTGVMFFEALEGSGITAWLDDEGGCRDEHGNVLQVPGEAA